MKKNEVSKMRSIKLFNLIKYLKSVDFYHDRCDLEEEGIEKILAEYGICDDFTAEELAELQKDVYEMAEKNEFREAVRLANMESDGMIEVY
jgi:hypothetical protein